jgi:hypothetical protein
VLVSPRVQPQQFSLEEHDLVANDASVGFQLGLAGAAEARAAAFPAKAFVLAIVVATTGNPRPSSPFSPTKPASRMASGPSLIGTTGSPHELRG